MEMKISGVTWYSNLLKETIQNGPFKAHPFCWTLDAVAHIGGRFAKFQSGHRPTASPGAHITLLSIPGRGSPLRSVLHPQPPIITIVFEGF